MDLLLYLVIPFLILMAIGVPVAFSLGTTVLMFLVLSKTVIPLTALPGQMFAALNSFPLLALPLFVLAGSLINRAGITERLLEFSDVLVGWMRGGLAQVNIVVSMFFGGISGSALADTSAIGSLLIPAMKKQRYDDDFTVAVTAASSVIGPIIPPSVPMIIIGAMLGVSIGGLFLAGLIPGMLVGFSLMAVTAVMSRRRGYVPASAFPTGRRFAVASVRAFPALLAPLIILVGIMTGVFTPTEAGAIASAYALLLGTLVYRTLTPRRVYEALLDTARLTATALFIVSVAVVFSRILSFYQVPQKLFALLLLITENRILLLILINGFLFVAGMFMDAVANLLILGPLVFPVLTELGMHPLQAGAMIVINLMIGLITPPLAMCLFIACGIAGIGLDQVTRAIIPFIIAEVIILLLVTYVPWVTLAVPKAAGLF